MEDDSREIIYIALCNQIELYSNALENNLLQGKERELAEYIILRSGELVDSMGEEIEDKPISRPSWKG